VEATTLRKFWREYVASSAAPQEKLQKKFSAKVTECSYFKMGMIATPCPAVAVLSLTRRRKIPQLIVRGLNSHLRKS
jgi:hypothetical protein